ncbi:MAG: PD-(D/E)XK nuclease family protein [Erysipelotrichaceae bacterium]
MNLSTIQKGIILADASQHPAIREALLSQQNIVTQVKLMDLRSYLYRFVPKPQMSANELVFEAYLRMQTLQPQLQTFQNSIHSYTFIEQLLTFLNHYHFYDMKPEDLPSDTPPQKELRLLIEALITLPSAQKALRQALFQASTMQHGEVYIVEGYRTYEEERMVQTLLSAGATLVQHAPHTPTMQLHSCVNMSQEVEYLAQQLIHNTHSVSVAVPNNEYKLLVEQFFTRYHLSFAFTQLDQPSRFASYYRALIQYYFERTPQQLRKLIALNPTKIKNTSALLEFMDNFEVSIEDDFSYVQRISFAAPYFSKQDKDATLRLAQTAQVAKEQLQEDLANVLEATSMEQMLNAVHAAIIHAHTNLSREQQQSILTIQHVLIDALPYLNQDTYPLLLSCLEQVKQQRTHDHHALIRVQSFQECNDTSTHLYVLGATQNNYPAFALHKGIFDESYYSLTPYPSMGQRFTLHVQQLEKQFLHYPKVTFSFPLSTYEGKPLECALEIERLYEFPKTQTVFPERTDFSFVANKQIPSALMKDLLLDQQTLKASISSMELFANCPLAYFLKYGLKLHGPIQTALKNNSIGSLIHTVFERLVQEHGAQYPNVDTSTLQSIVSEEVDKLIEVYPSLQAALALVKVRLIQLFEDNWSFLVPFEAQTHLAPLHTEYTFQQNLTFSNGITLQFKGIVDRINANNDRFTIVDYKSSAHQFKEEAFASGTQLQLLTYASMLEATLNRKCVGAFYYNVRPRRLPLSAYKMMRQKKELVDLRDTQLLKEQRQKAYTFSGVAFLDELALLEQTPTFHKNTGKDGFKKVVNLDHATQVLLQIYETLLDSLLRGTIEATPNKDKCPYCIYQSVCRENSSDAPNKVDPLVDLAALPFYSKGGKSYDDEME